MKQSRDLKRLLRNLAMTLINVL